MTVTVAGHEQTTCSAPQPGDNYPGPSHKLVVMIRVESGKATLDDATLHAIQRIAAETDHEVRELLPGLPSDLVLAVAPGRRVLPLEW